VLDGSLVHTIHSAAQSSENHSLIAAAANLGIKAHAHMLRHACGYKLANDGIDTRALPAYLGHRNIQNTTRYTALAPDRFKGFWKD
jgi:site-specific recombinase XerD